MRGYRALGEAARSLATFDAAAAEDAASAALAALPHRSPAVAWARLARLTAGYFAGKPDIGETEALVQGIATDLSTRGRARWCLGTWRTRHGDFMGGLSAYREALSLYERLQERDAVAMLKFYLSEIYSALGQDGPAWSYRLQALAAAPTLAEHDRTFSILLGSAAAALSDNRLRVANALLEELAGRKPPAKADKRAEMYLWRARVSTALGNRDIARSDLQRAVAWADRADPGRRLRLTGELALRPWIVGARSSFGHRDLRSRGDGVRGRQPCGPPPRRLDRPRGRAT